MRRRPCLRLAPTPTSAREFRVPRGLAPGLIAYRLYPGGRLSRRYAFAEVAHA